MAKRRTNQRKNKRRKPQGRFVRRPEVGILRTYRAPAKAEAAVQLLGLCGLRAATDLKDLGRPGERIYSRKGTLLWVRDEDSERASEILELAARFATQPGEPLELPPEDGTLENLDMLIHDCRQYLMIATGELKDITEEGVLDLDDPTNDILKITIRLKRLKGQCMRMAGRIPLDWEHGGGLGPLPS